MLTAPSTWPLRYSRGVLTSTIVTVLAPPDSLAQRSGTDDFEPLQVAVAAAPGVDAADQVARDVVEADAQQLPQRFFGVARIVDDEKQLAAGRHDPAGPVADARAERQAQRSTDVARAERFSAAQVEDERAGVDERRHLAGVERRRRRHPVRQRQHRRALPIDLLHPREVRRRVRQVAENGGDESVALAQLQERIVSPLAADGRVRRLADAGAAERAGAVARVHLDVIVELEQDVEERGEQLAGEGSHLIFAEQIRPPDRTNEERVAGQDPNRRAGFAHDDRNVLRRVSRRVQEREDDVADAQLLPMRHFLRRKRRVRARADDGDGAAGRQAPGPRRRSRRGCGSQSRG